MRRWRRVVRPRSARYPARARPFPRARRGRLPGSGRRGFGCDSPSPPPNGSTPSAVANVGISVGGTRGSALRSDTTSRSTAISCLLIRAPPARERSASASRATRNHVDEQSGKKDRQHPVDRRRLGDEEEVARQQIARRQRGGSTACRARGLLEDEHPIARNRRLLRWSVHDHREPEPQSVGRGECDRRPSAGRHRRREAREQWERRGGSATPMAGASGRASPPTARGAGAHPSVAAGHRVRVGSPTERALATVAKCAASMMTSSGSPTSDRRRHQVVHGGENVRVVGQRTGERRSTRGLRRDTARDQSGGRDQHARARNFRKSSVAEPPHAHRELRQSLGGGGIHVGPRAR